MDAAWAAGDADELGMEMEELRRAYGWHPLAMVQNLGEFLTKYDSNKCHRVGLVVNVTGPLYLDSNSVVKG